jgi:hypothetical protein
VVLITSLGYASFVIASGAPAVSDPISDLPPQPGELLTVVGPDGQTIVCPNGQQLQVPSVGVPAGTVSGQPDSQDPGADLAPENTPAPPLVPRCGPDNNPVWEPLADGAPTVDDLGFDGTCDVTATLQHYLVAQSIGLKNDTYAFDFNATGSCNGKLDDETLTDVPVSFNFHDEYSCGIVDGGTIDSTGHPLGTEWNNEKATLAFDGLFVPSTDPSIDVEIDYRSAGAESDVRGSEGGSAALTGNQTSSVHPCRASSGTFTGKLQTAGRLEG